MAAGTGTTSCSIASVGRAAPSSSSMGAGVDAVTMVQERATAATKQPAVEFVSTLSHAHSTLEQTNMITGCSDAWYLL